MAHAIRSRPNESRLGRLNPITKLVVGGVLVVMGFLTPTYAGSVLIVGLVLGVGYTAGVLRKVLKLASPVLITLFVGVMVLQGLFNEGSQGALFTLGPLTLWREGVHQALTVFFRVFVIVSVVLVILLSTHPKDVVVSLTERGVSPKLTYVLVSSLQAIPQMQARARLILEAQQSRGLDVKASLPRRLRATATILVPLLTGALISAETRSLALEARGFSRPGQRTYLRSVEDTRAEQVLRWFAVATLGVMVVWRLVTWLT